MSLLLGKYFKSPGERKRYMIDYSDWLDAGELVATVTFEVTSPAANDATPVIVDGNSLNPDFKGVTFFVSAGTAGVTYKAVVTMITSAGQDRVDSVQYAVRAA